MKFLYFFASGKQIMSKFIRSFKQDGNIELKLVAVLAATIYISMHIAVFLP